MFDDAEHLWVIHMGSSDVVALRAKEGGFIAIGWHDMGDLSGLHSRKDFKAAMQKTYPDLRKNQINSMYGQVYRFVQAIEVGDPVIFPIKPTKEIAIGRVTGEYEGPSSDPDLVESGLINTRSVEWLKVVPRTIFSQPALYSFGSFSTVSTSDDHLDEVVGVLEGNLVEKPHSATAESGDSATQLADEEADSLHQKALEFTEDYLLKQWQGTGHAFEHVVAAVLEALGYTARVTPPSGDFGVDVVAHHDRLGLEAPVLKVQVKSGAGSVGSPDVNQLKGTLHPGEKGMLVCLGTFSPAAYTVSQGAPDIVLVNGTEFVQLFLDAYDRLSAKWQARYPLEIVYVPQSPVS